MSGYTKLFSSITDSTIWQAPDPVRLVWITMLAMADQHGYVGASVPGLASRARVSLDDCVAALASFQSPDEWSRTKDHGGRRIAEADGGWILLNHAKYRAARDADERREQARAAMAKLREKRRVSKSVNNVNGVGLGEPPLAQAEAEAEAINQKPSRSARKKPVDNSSDAEWLTLRACISNNRAPDSETLQAVAKKLGGLDRLGAMTTYELDRKRKDFDAAYRLALNGGPAA